MVNDTGQNNNQITLNVIITLFYIIAQIQMHLHWAFALKISWLQLDSKLDANHGIESPDLSGKLKHC